MTYVAICRYCSLEISYESKYINLLTHLREEHSEKLTEEQKTDDNINWKWDYYTPITDKIAKCNICGKIVNSKFVVNLRKHLDA